MAKTVTEKQTKVAKPKKSLLSSVAESSKKSTTKSLAASKSTIAEKPSNKAAGKRKLAEVTDGVEVVKKARKAVMEADGVDTTEKQNGKETAKDDKPKEKGKKKAAVVEEKEVTAMVKNKGAKKNVASKPKAKSPSPAKSEVEEQAGSNAKEDAASGEEENVQMFGFSTDDDDDSSDDEMNEERDAIDVGKLPTIAKDDAVVKRKLEKAKRKPTENRGVIYLGRIPHGFYEAQMKSYFTQFGEVTRQRLSRNKRTGRSKHYAFIEFESSSVAEIVAETMDNYLLMGHILTCKVIPKDEVHPELWVGANKKWRSVPRDRVARVQHNKPRTAEEQEKAEKRLLKRQAQKKRKLEEAGIKYDFDAVAYKKKPTSADS